MTNIDTIYALASAPGKAAIAVIRISGANAFSVLESFGVAPPRPRNLCMRLLMHPESKELLDQALVVRFAEGKSFTGERLVELHLHGGRASVESIMSVLARLPNFRAAEPGEFMRRAFANGRVDLVQAEAVADMIDAETEAQRHLAAQLMSGVAQDKIKDWRQQLLEALAFIEAEIDFADEELPEKLATSACANIVSILSSLEQECAGARAGERLRLGYEVAIVGPPNAGKSTLINTLAGREVALVSGHPGTTRDALTVALDWEGLPVTLVDMAGLRETSDEIELMGVDLARRRARDADLRLFLRPADAADGADHAEVECRNEDIHIISKCDLIDQVPDDDGKLYVSANSGAGLDELSQRISEILSRRASSSSALGSSARRQALLAGAVEHLQKAQTELASGEYNTELVAEEIRTCLRLLENIIGAIDTEEVLEHIFSRFCIGK